MGVKSDLVFSFVFLGRRPLKADKHPNTVIGKGGQIVCDGDSGRRGQWKGSTGKAGEGPVGSRTSGGRLDR